MQPKNYQRRVLRDLDNYLETLEATNSLSEAYRLHIERTDLGAGLSFNSTYHSDIAGVPHISYKVPTGGGKTYLGCCSLRTIFNHFPATKVKAVVWLVPTDPILTQTLAALQDRSHPYRQQLESDFNGRVEVYSKPQLLAGQTFSPATVAEQLSLMVLSYDSFRATTGEGLKAYQANGALLDFQNAFGAPEYPIANAAPSSLFQIINQMNPVLVVDESHHTGSHLSKEMLQDFNPSLILDLTATPLPEANIVSRVTALELKQEHMVKLPVIAYNRPEQDLVIADAIDLRERLEEEAEVEAKNGGAYIRPIALIQAEPKVKSDSATFGRVHDLLVANGIPESQIAIKTASRDTLTGIDLESPDCEIRYIVTVNALGEGWDCPFAYILASLSNRSTEIAVEQIVGRILRQPETRKHSSELLNMSYVLASSDSFMSTLDSIVEGLNDAGFSAADCRPSSVLVATSQVSGADATLPTPAVEHALVQAPQFADAPHFPGSVRRELRATPAPTLDAARGDKGDGQAPSLEPLIAFARQEDRRYLEGQPAVFAPKSQLSESSKNGTDTTSSLTYIVPKFVESAAATVLPQFVVDVPQSALFSTPDDTTELLHREFLTRDFRLAAQDAHIDLADIDEDMFRIDVDMESAETPRAYRMNQADQVMIRSYLNSLPTEGKRRQAVEIIFDQLNKFDFIAARDLKDYITRIIEGMDSAQLAMLIESPRAVRERISQKIQSLANAHRSAAFKKAVSSGQISTAPTYHLPETMTVRKPNSTLGRSLYNAEDGMNRDEMAFASRLSAAPTVFWWHRNVERTGFCINGAINHYPDFIVRTTSGTIVLAETKGEQLKNDDSAQKIELGREWASLCGRGYRYFMVFKDGVTPLAGGETVSSFFQILSNL